MIKNKVIQYSKTNKICSEYSSFLNKSQTNLICANHKPKYNAFLKTLNKCGFYFILKKKFLHTLGSEGFLKEKTFGTQAS